jgi:putative membrane protein
MIFVGVLYLVGLVGHIIPDLRNIMLLLTPIMLFVSGIVVIAVSYDKPNIKLIIWMIAIYIVTFLSEVIGVQTGFIFGKYFYGNTLGVSLFNVPLIIGFNWLIIILGAISIARLIDKSTVITASLAAVLAVLFDLMLEPIAIKLDYWKWVNGSVPLRNYYAWFAITFASSFLYDKMKVNIIRSELFRFYFIVQLIFFVLLLLIMT